MLENKVKQMEEETEKAEPIPEVMIDSAKPAHDNKFVQPATQDLLAAGYRTIPTKAKVSSQSTLPEGSGTQGQDSGI